MCLVAILSPPSVTFDAASAVLSYPLQFGLRQIYEVVTGVVVVAAKAAQLVIELRPAPESVAAGTPAAGGSRMCFCAPFSRATQRGAVELLSAFRTRGNSHVFSPWR